MSDPVTSDPVARLNAALEGRYAIARELGEGGMATVYLADDLKHERKVALKVLRPELAAVVGAERFLTEIKVTANLQHPHILPLHDSGEADSFLFYVMPYVEGETLRDRIDREKQLPVDEAVALATKVAGALQHAHEHGVIHRDIKPGNILLQGGEPVVADFGIALALGVAGGTRLTETGLSVGTPFYMSPEQATGDQVVGASTDTYALGSVLYEMLVGEPPYPGTTAQAVLGKIIAGKPVSATEHRPSIPANVDAAVRKALEKLPADRFASAQEFIRALGDEHFGYGELSAAGASAAVGPWNRLTTLGWSAAALFAVAFAWSLLRPEPPPPVSRQVLSTEGWAGLEVPFGRYAAIAPDGSSMILPVRSPGGDLQLALKMLGSTEITPIPGTEGSRDVVYSLDSEWIVYSVGGDLFKRPLVGGSPVRLSQDAPTTTGVVGLAWLDDGTILHEQFNPTESRVRRIARISEDGGEPLEVVFGLEEEVGIVWVHGLPGARGAFVVACPGQLCPAESTQLHIVDLEDLSSEIVFEQVLRAWYAPTGHIVYVRIDGAVLAQPFDLATLELTGSSIPLFEGVRGSGPATSQLPDMVLGADGTLLYVEGSAALTAGGTRRLFVVDLEGNEEALVLAPRDFFSVGWSPDGQSVVYSSEAQIYTYNVALGTTPRQLTFDGNNFNPVFSPDGSRVAFQSTREGTVGTDLFVKNLDDDSPPRSIITLDANQRLTQWSSDSLIVFERGDGGVRDIWMVDLSDPDSGRAEAYLSSEADLRSIVVSPDGTLAAYSSNESGQYEIYIRSFPEPGARTVVSQGGGGVPFWSPDGNTLYYARGAPGVGATFTAASIERNPVPVVVSTDSLFTVPLSARPFQGSGLHPDGDRWILVQGVGTADPEAGAEPQRLIMVTNFFEELQERVGH